MYGRSWLRAFWILIAVVVVAPPVATFALQPSTELLRGVDALRSIPAPQPVEIRPRLFAAYGALVAASFALSARGYADVRLGSVMIGLSQLLAVWSAGLLLLSVDEFSERPRRWDVPVQAAAATAVWFLAAPFVLPLSAVLYTGPAATAVLSGWASVRYARLTKRTPIVGALMISGALAVMASLDAVGAL